MPLSLKQVVTSVNAIIQDSQFTKLFSSSQSYHQIIEGLFAYFFPDSATMYSKGDIEFFLTFTNEQDALKDCVQSFHSDNQSLNIINLSKFKFHLDKILCKGWSKGGAHANPLDCYKLEVYAIFI